MAVTLIAMLMVTGPSRAMKSPSWAKANAAISFGPAVWVGGAKSDAGTGLSCPGMPEFSKPGPAAERVLGDAETSADGLRPEPSVVIAAPDARSRCFDRTLQRRW